VHLRETDAVQVRGDRVGAAEAANAVLRRLMPSGSGRLSYAAVADACGCSPSTPPRWLLRDGHLAVPDDAGRARLAALVEHHLGGGARATLESAWMTLLTPEPDALDRGAGDDRPGAPAATEPAELTLADRQTIIEQAQLVLAEAYAHLPFKRALHAVDPVQRLRLLAYRLSSQTADVQSEVEFHREMIDIFTSVRDLHTTYIVPRRYRKAVVLLPFRVEECFQQSADGVHVPLYVATKVDDAQAVAAGFTEGVTITHWNGVPIRRAIELLAERQAAGNQPAAFARALDALTLRPLLSSMPPDEDWVEVTFTSASGRPTSTRFTWQPRDAPDDLLPDHLEVALGIDAQTHAVSAVRKELYGRQDRRWDAADEERGILTQPIALAERHLETHMPWSFRAHPTDDDRFGYLRIFSFDTRQPAEFIAEFGRLASVLPQAGLIVDVRGNAGGSIAAAEGVLQVLAKEPIHPVRAQFTTSPLLLRICEDHAVPSPGIPLHLQPWIRSLRQAVATGSAYSQGFPITTADVLGAVGHRYPGPSVLIVDALCYSATDMFAAGFVDHGLGSVLGIADNTGAGGANVWRHRDLLKLAGDDSGLVPLPDDIDFRVAVRRVTRVREHEGEILEDLGIEITERYHMTRADLFEGNRDLIATAAARLAALSEQ